VHGCAIIAQTNWEPTTIILQIMFVRINKELDALEVHCLVFLTLAVLLNKISYIFVYEILLLNFIQKYPKLTFP
jgi:hypothetical protein